MFKRSLVFIMLLSALAFTNESQASRARLIVLGTGDAGMLLDGAITAAGTVAYGGGGSFFYNDPYNMFYNPSYVNDFKDWAVVEKSNFAGPAFAGGSTAQGGFVTSFFNFNIGVYVNRIDAVRTLSVASAAATRPIEITFGADMGVKWGLGVLVANRNTATATDQIYTIRAGAQFMDFDPFVHYSVGGQDQTGGTSNHTAMTFGMRYHWGEWIPFATYRQDKTTTAATNVDNKTDAWGVGMGRESKVSDSMKTMYSIAFVRATSTAAADHSVVPFNFGVEGDVTSWLTLRAGLGYNVYDKTGGNSAGDTTTGRIGASIKVGKADLAFAFGKAGFSAGTQTTGEAPSGTAQNVDGQNFDLGSGLFTAASLSYKW